VVSKPNYSAIGKILGRKKNALMLKAEGVFAGGGKRA
jgi:hypothetical protein